MIWHIFRGTTVPTSSSWRRETLCRSIWRTRSPNASSSSYRNLGTIQCVHIAFQLFVTNVLQMNPKSRYRKRMLLIVWSRQFNWWRIWTRRLPSWRTLKRWLGPVSLSFYLRITYSSNEFLASVKGTLLDAKCFRNILEFRDAHKVPHLSTEIIFQMAILGGLRLRWISTNTAHI